MSGYIWRRRLVLVAICFVILFLRLLPVQSTMPSWWAGVDLMLAVVLAWSVRRPQYVPMVIVAVLFLLADLLLQRPPGLYAALALIGSEWIKRNGPTLREAGFGVELLNSAVVIAVIFFVYQLSLTLMVVPVAPVRPHVTQMFATILAYPIAVLGSYLLFGISRPMLTDSQAGGRS